MKSWIVAIALAAGALSAQAQDKVVYHFDNTAAQGLKGLRNMRNHLDVDPKAQLTAVAHAEGVDFLMEGAKAANGTEFAPLVSALKNRDLKKEQFILDAEFTPSGVVRVAKLQKEGAAYIKL
jgi:intracellular sulfur oxidation DsrE/DsrF family protein